MRIRRYPALVAIADQGSYAATNLVMVITVARGASPDEFGRFSAVYLGVILALAVCRARFGQPLLYTFRSERADGRFMVALSATMAIGLLALSALLGSGSAAIASAALPLLAFQDRVRYRCLGAGKPELALGSDASWLLAQVGALAVLELAWGARSPNLGVGAWVLGAFVASIWGRATTSRLTDGRGGRSSIDINIRSVQRAFLADAAISFGRNQGFILIFAALSSWSASGAMRLCFSLLGFVPVISQGLISAYLPRIVNLQPGTRSDAGGTARRLQLISLTTGGVGLLIAVAADHFSILARVFGAEAWSAAQPLFLWVVLLHLGFLLEAPLHVLLMGHVGLPFTVRGKGASALLHLTFTTTGLLLSSSARGGVIGMVVAEVVVLTMWQSAWRRHNPDPPVKTEWHRLATDES